MGKIVTTTFSLINAKQIALIFEKINGMKESNAVKKKRKEGRIQTSMLYFDCLQELSPIKKEERNLFREADKLLKDSCFNTGKLLKKSTGKRPWFGPLLQ